MDTLSLSLQQDIVLTRYLYDKTRVRQSLFVSLMLDYPLSHSFFWANELYESGYTDELWSLLWYTYYVGFAVEFPFLETLLSKQEAKWRETPTNIEPILKVIKNLNLRKERASDVFYIHMLYKTLTQDKSRAVTTEKYRGRRSELVKSFDKQDQTFIIALEKFHKRQIAYEMSQRTIDDVYGIFQTYLERKWKITDLESKMPMSLNEPLTYLLSTYVSRINPIPSSKLSKAVFVKGTKDDLAAWNSLNVSSCQPVRVLAEHTTKPYPKEVIDYYHSAQSLWAEDAIRDAYWYNWEILAFETPLWRERFTSHGASLVKDDDVSTYTVKIVWEDDDKKEVFYEKYGYEFDEQPKDVQKRLIATPQVVDYSVEQLQTPYIL